MQRRQVKRSEMPIQISCPNCKQVCESEQELAVGQHVICPFCHVKFSYEKPFVRRTSKVQRPCILTIASAIYFILGVILMLGGSASCRTHLWLAFWCIGGVGLLLAAYFMSIGHEAALRIAFLALGLLATGRILSSISYGISELFGMILFIFPIGVCFLQSSQAWLKQHSRLSSHDWIEFVERFKSLSWFMKGVWLLVCAVTLFNLSKEPSNESRDDSKNSVVESASLLDYRSSVWKKIDPQIGPSKDGVFGLRWGEKPESEQFRVPCQVIYNVKYDYSEKTPIFNYLKLGYSKDGLCVVSLESDQFGDEESAYRAFENIISFAKKISGRTFKTFTQGTILLATATEPERGALICRVDTPCESERKRLIFIAKPKR